MSTTTPQAGSRIIPTLRYQDAPAAIEWLCKALGFERHLVVPGQESGQVDHAQLTFGSQMIMLGSAQPGYFEGRIQTPSEVGGVNTQTAYVIVDEIDEHYARAKASGAEIVYDIRDEDYGGRGYSCRDPEGYIWHFGSYDPWKADH
jgi:uncharacterized glyoxalase superfamily protein PhnB